MVNGYSEVQAVYGYLRVYKGLRYYKNKSIKIKLKLTVGLHLHNVSLVLWENFVSKPLLKNKPYVLSNLQTTA